MIRRTIQFLAVCAMAALTVMYLLQHGYFSVFSTYWRETLFAALGLAAGWMFAVTQALRPVVAIFAAAAFFLVAKMEEPTGASLVATLGGIGDRVLALADALPLG